MPTISSTCPCMQGLSVRWSVGNKSRFLPYPFALPIPNLPTVLPIRWLVNCESPGYQSIQNSMLTFFQPLPPFLIHWPCLWSGQGHFAALIMMTCWWKPTLVLGRNLDTGFCKLARFLIASESWTQLRDTEETESVFFLSNSTTNLSFTPVRWSKSVSKATGGSNGHFQTND